MAFAEVDMAYDEETVEECISRLESQYGIKIEVQVLNGPGGGWPCVKLTGTDAQVEAALRGSWGFEDEDVKEYVRS